MKWVKILGKNTNLNSKFKISEGDHCYLIKKWYATTKLTHEHMTLLIVTERKFHNHNQIKQVIFSKCVKTLIFYWNLLLELIKNTLNFFKRVIMC